MKKIYLQEIDMSQYIIKNIISIKSVITEILNDIKNEYNINEEIYFNIRLVLSELLSNSFEHNEIKKSINVWLNLNYSPKKIHIKINDFGTGFDINAIKKNDIKENIYKKSGRGLSIVYSLCESIEYNSIGNTVSIVIKI